MQVCPTRQPPPFGAHHTECWLHDTSLTEAQRAPLQRQEVSVADEA
jgi:hypothetical protein